MEKMKPRVAIVMGDPAGIGPEIAVRAIASPEIQQLCEPLVIGDARVVQKALAVAREKLSLRSLRQISEWAPRSSRTGTVNVLDTRNVDTDQLVVGKASVIGGRAVFEDIQLAVKLAGEKQVDGFVAGPHNKYSVNMAGVAFAGYPPFLAKLTGSRYAFNMLISGSIRVVGATLHLPLKDVSQALTPDLIMGCIEAVQVALRRLNIPGPRIAVAGLNPHCGEEGLFGSEEQTVIGPAIEAARARGIDVSGPFPADSLFVALGEKQDFDAYVAMYHDQSHIGIKTVAFDSIAGIIIGIPLVVATVGHGTAFEIAGKGMANAGPMMETIKLVARSAQGTGR